MADKKNKKVLAIFIDGTFIPSREGATNRFLNLTRKLTEHNFKVIVIHCYRGWSNLNLIKKEKFTTYFLEPKNYYYNFDLITNILKKENVNIIQFNDPSVLTYLGLNIKKRYPSFLIYEAHDVVSQLLKNLGKENKKILKKERKAVQIADGIICFTQKDKNQLIKLGANKEKIIINPCGVNIKEVLYCGPNLKAKNLLFLGNHFYEPNRRALDYLLKRIIPILFKNEPKISLKIVGNYPLNRYQEHFKNKRIDFLGFVPDLNSVFKKTTIALAPIKFGSGIRIKILNYMAAGIPTISTTLGASGIENKKSLIIENNLSKYPELIISLLKDKEKLIEISKNARDVIEKKYSWEIISQEIIKYYNSIENKSFVGSKKNEPDKKFILPHWLEENLKKERFNDKDFLFKDKEYLYGKAGNNSLILKKRYF